MRRSAYFLHIEISLTCIPYYIAKIPRFIGKPRSIFNCLEDPSRANAAWAPPLDAAALNPRHFTQIAKAQFHTEQRSFRIDTYLFTCHSLTYSNVYFRLYRSNPKSSFHPPNCPSPTTDRNHPFHALTTYNTGSPQRNPDITWTPDWLHNTFNKSIISGGTEERAISHVCDEALRKGMAILVDILKISFMKRLEFALIIRANMDSQELQKVPHNPFSTVDRPPHSSRLCCRLNKRRDLRVQQELY